MKASLGKSRVSASLSVPDYSLHEYHWDGPRRLHVPVWRLRQTTLLVVFDGESRHLFSTARILLYYSNSDPSLRANVWDIQQPGPVIHSFRSQVQDAPPNASTLPKLTVAFEVVVEQTASISSFGTLVLRSPASIQELSRNSISVLLEYEVPLTSDTLSLSLSFCHSTMLCTTVAPGPFAQHFVPIDPTSWIECITTRIVRVVPPISTRRRIFNGCLPIELLIKTFEDAEFCDSWHEDLLSFAQVCQAWSCAVDVLHSHMSFEDDDMQSQSRQLLDVYALARTLSENPLLGRRFRHFTTNNLGKMENWQDNFNSPPRENLAHFTTALMGILRATKCLQSLHLGRLDPRQADALFAVLHDLRDIHTFSIRQVEDSGRPSGVSSGRHGTDGVALSVVQLARCMGSWPALKSLRVHQLHPESFGVRQPSPRLGCTLTQLTISRSHVNDEDLVHLFASSAKSLERVVLDRVKGVTNAGLFGFLLAISQNVMYLTVQHVTPPPPQERGELVIERTETALDVVVDKMPRLRELRIGGDVASEFMLDRRSKMFVTHNASEKTQVPVVRLWLENVPRLRWPVADAKWPGWCTPGKVPRR